MWPDTRDTQELMHQAGQGQAEAINALLERHRDALRNMIRARLDQRLSRRVDASDVAQDVLLEASQRLVAYLKDPRLPFSLWLRELAKDRIIDLHRRHRVAVRRSLDREQPLSPANFGDRSSLELAAQLQDPELTPAAMALRKELHERFLDALDRMQEEDREILVMRHIEQLTNSEAAAILGLEPPAAGMRHLRALRRMRDILGAGGSAP
ncbi:MAG: sigma-70 family RNA polymerase sigma factor [Planctomycetales bacterium]